MSCVHENTANIKAGASAVGAPSHFDISAGITYSDWPAAGSASASARIKSGRELHYGASCGVVGEATVEAQSGGGQYRGRGSRYVTGRAAVSGDAAITHDHLVTPITVFGRPLNVQDSSIEPGMAHGTASVEANAGVIFYAEPCGCKIKGTANTFGWAFLEPHAFLYGYADAIGEWRILVEPDYDGSETPVGIASAVGDLTANWNMLGSATGIASMGGGETIASASASASASVVESFPVIFYSNGMLKLKGIAAIMQNLLPQYMQDGEIIKRFLEIYGTEIERATYVRSGFPPGGSGVGGVVQQFAVITATWGLDLWESMLGLPIRTGDTDYAARRGEILSKLASRRNESEYWFKRRLELLITTTSNPNPVIFINPGEPSVEPYTIEIESNVLLGELAPTYAMTTTAHASPGVLTGVYTYKATYVFLTGETDEGLSESPSITISAGRVILGNIPVSPDAAISRKIYRKNGAGQPWRLLTTIPDNTTATYVDNISDAAISTNPIISPFNTATTVLGQKFLDFIDATKPAHIHVNVRSDRFRASINKAGDPV